MSEDCPHCVFNETESDCPGCFEGSHYKPKPSSNADRIRHMTDEELAMWLEERLTDCPWCSPNAPVKPGTTECELEDCTKCALDWLRQEVMPNDS